MTACCRDHLPVKSSVYNQTGENFYQQLGIYNHMNTHLRRVLQAKCVVESKNPRYVQRHDYHYFRHGKCLHKCQSHDNITKSARDSHYHLIDILKPTSGINKGSTKSLVSLKSQNYDKSKHSTHSRRNPLSKQGIDVSKPTVHVVEPKRPGISDYTNDQIYPDYASSFEASTNASERRNSISKEPKSPLNSQKQSKSRKIKLENLKYLKFLHDITQEIIKTGVYTDEEIKNVFQKHLTKNLGILNKTKMLKKMRQLKSSFNIADSEDEEEIDSDTSTEKISSSMEKNQSIISKNDEKIDESEKSNKNSETDDEKLNDNSEDSNASQVSQDSIEWQSEIESVINEDDSISEKINPLTM